MSFVKTGAFRGLQSDSDDIKIDTSGNVAIINSNIVNKNLLINGGMNVWQRNTSATASSTGYKTVDRFEYSQNGTAAYTQSRSTDVPSGQGFGYSMKMDVTTALASPAAGNYSMFMQKMEGQNLQHLLKGSSSAKSLTLSFWVKSNKTGTYIVRISDEDNSRTISKSYTVDSANTWEKKTITYAGDTTGALDNDNAESLTVQWWLSAGTSYTSGTLATSWESTTNANIAVGITNLLDSTSNEWYITGIQLEVGENASGFEFEPHETVLRKCQRYYEHTYPDGEVPGVSTTEHAHHEHSWFNGDTTGPTFREVKCRVPDFTLYTNANPPVSGKVHQGGVDRTAGGVRINERGVSYINVSSGSGTYTRFNWVADAEL